MQNFTVVDTLGALKGCLFLAPFLLAPGYATGWAFDLFGFRQRRLLLRWIIAVPLSIAICPMPSYLLARFFPPGLWAFYIGMLAACLLLLAKELRPSKLRLFTGRIFSRQILIALGLAASFALVGVASMVDLQIGDTLYPPIVAFDHSVRTAITVAVARHLPPNNPFFANGGVQLRYHYLWLLFCSLPMRVAQLSARDMVASGVVWCSLALLCTVVLGLKFLIGVRTSVERKALLGIVLLAATGLDILPTIYIRMTQGIWLSDMEWWNETQITSWAGSVLWVPHNVAALIACFVAFLLLRYQIDAHQRWGTGPVIVAGMAFASAAGMSVYVTFTFVIAFTLWLLALVTRKQWLEVTMFLCAGVVALGCGMSFLLSLRSAGSGSPDSVAAFAEFGLRPFSFGIQLVQRAGIHFESQFALTLANALLLPINYALELGFFLAVGIVRLVQLVRRKIEISTNEQVTWTLVATSFLVGTFFRSTTTGTNDLGWRCFLPAQFILLLWGTTLVHDWWLEGGSAGTSARPGRWAQGALVALLLLGLAGTGYQVFMLRMFPVLQDRGVIAGPSWVSPNLQFGRRAYALRTAYADLDSQLPSSAVLQGKPDSEDVILHTLYSGHDAAAGFVRCGIDFGGDASTCDLRRRKLGRLFASPDGSGLDAICQEYGIDALIVEDMDPVWKEASSWVWRERPAVANDYVRAFPCGTLGSRLGR